MDCTNYCILVPQPRADIRGLPKQNIYPVVSTLSVLAAFPASTRFTPRAITVLIQLAAQICVCQGVALRTEEALRRGTSFLRISGNKRLDSIGSSNWCRTKGLPPFEKRFCDIPQAYLIPKWIRVCALCHHARPIRLLLVSTRGVSYDSAGIVP